MGAILAERENVVELFCSNRSSGPYFEYFNDVNCILLVKFFGTGNVSKKAIAIECGLQNGTLAIFVGTSVFGGGLYIIPAATYSLIMYLTSLIFIYFIKNR